MSAPGRAAIALFTVLLAATCGAFFLAARLKAAPAVLERVHRLDAFSPNGDGRRDRMRISFRLEQTDDVAVEVIDRDGTRVRRLSDAVHAARGRRVRVSWDGRLDGGARAPDGAYRIRLILRREGRSVVAPEPFELDTRPPAPAVLVDPGDAIVAPGRSVDFKTRGVGPRATPRFRVLRTDVSPIRTVRRFAGRAGRRDASWDGRRDDGGDAVPGTYLIAVTSRDTAGNEGTGPVLPPRPGAIDGRPGVTVRRLAVQPPVRPVTAGELVAFRVDARGRRYSWSVRRVGAPRPVKRNRRPKRGTALVFRAPNGISGVYLLEVRSGGHATRVPFAVQPRPDGLPNTLSNGSVVPFPRPFAGDGGLPEHFAAEVAPLLVFLDRSRIRYDLATDLALALAPEGPEPERGGLLFAGSPEWVTRGLARRLRRFAGAGGRVALFGPRALRAGVTIGDGQLTHATAPAPTDALGGRVADVRQLPRGEDGAPPPLTVLAEEPGAGLLEGFGGELGGFEAVEELTSPGSRAKLVASVGHAISEQEAIAAEEANRTPREERPALSAAQAGRGLVIRVGLPGWGGRLEARDASVAQITRNIADLLRGVRPRPRSLPR